MEELQEKSPGKTNQENAWKRAHLGSPNTGAIAPELTRGLSSGFLAKCREGISDRIAFGITEKSKIQKNWKRCLCTLSETHFSQLQRSRFTPAV